MKRSIDWGFLLVLAGIIGMGVAILLLGFEVEELRAELEELKP